MSVGPHPEPVRSCIGCRQRRARSALVRVTMADGSVGVDGPSRGRGAWLCRATAEGELVDAACLDAALSRRAFARAWKHDLDARDERAIRHLLGRSADDDEHRMRTDISIREAKTTVKG